MNNINNQISKLNHNTYQYIELDKATGDIRISEPWYGRILYASGCRTDIDELSNHLIAYLNTSRNELKNHISEVDKGQLFDLLTTTKIFSKMIKDRKFQKCDHTSDYLSLVKDIKSEFGAYLKQKERVPKFEDVEKIVTNQDKITVKEEMMKNFYLKRNKVHKKILEAYKTIYLKTKNLELDESKKETFRFYDFDLKDNLIGETLAAYRLGPDQKFLVHATALENALPLCTLFENNDFVTPSFCTSLIDSRTGFFGMNNTAHIPRVALLLAVDPKQIILTSPSDIGSPSKFNTKYNEIQIAQFYDRQDRIMLLTTRLHQIIDGSETEIVYNEALNNLKQKYLLLIDELKQEFPDAKMTRDMIIPMFNKRDLAKISDPKRYLEMEKKVIEAYKEYQKLKDTQFLDFFQIYYANSDKNFSPEEFLKVFNYPGSDINKEMEKYIQLLNQLSKQFLPMHIAPLLSPEKLLEETLSTGTVKEVGWNPYNEVNVKLDFEGKKNNPEIKGIMITRGNLEKYSKPPTQTGEIGEWAEFADLIKHAQNNNIKIFIVEEKKIAKL